MSRKSPKKQPEKATFTPPSGEGDQPSKISEADVPPESAGTRPQDVGEEVGQLRQRLQRLGADFQNYQKRTQKQIEQAAEMARQDLVRSLLPVLDNFEHTLENLNKEGQNHDVTSLVQGIGIVYDHLRGDLKSTGLRKIEVRQGDPFDPSLHEAMLHEESDEFAENSVLRELAAGYTMRDRTLRPAKVSVAKAPIKVADSVDEPVQESGLPEESTNNNSGNDPE